MLSIFPLDDLDEIWDVIESVSEGFLTYSFNESGIKTVYAVAHYLYTLIVFKTEKIPNSKR